MGVVDMDVHILSHLKYKLSWAADKWLSVICTIMMYNGFTSKIFVAPDL